MTEKSTELAGNTNTADREQDWQLYPVDLYSASVTVRSQENHDDIFEKLRNGPASASAATPERGNLPLT